MPFCQNCGTEVNGSFCANCGTQVGAAAPAYEQVVIHENADVKPRYSVGALALAGYLGLTFLLTTVIVVVMMLAMGGTFFSEEGGLGGLLGFLIGGALTGGLAYLCYLPGLKMIRKRTPQEEVSKTIRSFFGKSLVFLIAWFVGIAGCVYIIGLFLKSWKLGLKVSQPKDDEYTAFVNGEKIGVIRLVDEEFSTPQKIRYIYMDDNGEFYRPSLH